jgi:hypothetical protein
VGPKVREEFLPRIVAEGPVVFVLVNPKAIEVAHVSIDQRSK